MLSEATFVLPNLHSIIAEIMFFRANKTCVKQAASKVLI